MEVLIGILQEKISYRGRIECKLLWSVGGASRYRVNWYIKANNTEHIENSAFIKVYDNGQVFMISENNHFSQLA